MKRININKILKRKLKIFIILLLFLSGCGEYQEKEIDTSIGKVLVLHNPTDTDNKDDWGKVSYEKDIDKDYIDSVITTMNELDISTIITANNLITRGLSVEKIKDTYEIKYDDFGEGIIIFSCTIAEGKYKCNAQNLKTSNDKQTFKRLVDK